MSTKTTFKRVALVTVAALGLGVMSVAPSNAAAELDSISVSVASTTQIVGGPVDAADFLNVTLRLKNSLYLCIRRFFNPSETAIRSSTRSSKNNAAKNLGQVKLKNRI